MYCLYFANEPVGKNAGNILPSYKSTHLFNHIVNLKATS